MISVDPVSVMSVEPEGSVDPVSKVTSVSPDPLSDVKDSVEIVDSKNI